MNSRLHSALQPFAIAAGIAILVIAPATSGESAPARGEASVAAPTSARRLQDGTTVPHDRPSGPERFTLGRMLARPSPAAGGPRPRGATVYYAAMNGDDDGPGTAASPFRTIQRAVDAAHPGDTVALHSGTFEETVRILHSGEPGKPIVLTAAGDGTVTVTSRQPVEPCNKTRPSKNRTIQVDEGSDHWIISSLTVVGGILISGKGGSRNVDSGTVDLTLPGRGDTYDPAANITTLETLRVDPADSVKIRGNILRGRGIYAYKARFGLIEHNDIGSVDCGTGPGILLSRFSDYWIVRDNRVHDLTASEGKIHFMNEGIRHSNGSMYNITEGNLVEDVQGRGRGITTDVHSSWNFIRRNTVRRADQGFSEQSAGRGNKWLDNVAEDNRHIGYNLFAQGAGERDRDSEARAADRVVPAFLEYRCNRSIGNPIGLNIGEVRETAFEQNDFGSVKLSGRARRHWTENGNTWEGATSPPTPTPPRPSLAACLHPGSADGDVLPDPR